MVRLGRSDLDVFPLCLGGNVFGWTADERQSFDVLAARGNRAQVVLATKVGRKPDRKRLSRANIRVAAQESLERLQTATSTTRTPTTRTRRSRNPGRVRRAGQRGHGPARRRLELQR